MWMGVRGLGGGMEGRMGRIEVGDGIWRSDFGLRWGCKRWVIIEVVV